ncbi:amidase family protein [Streptomyces clavuligerus]|uniref:Secreted amidase n=3 Tax=Streptomyces clavuligerus TaxID=1901 RepID=B5GYG4_STRCL|nr:amidase family protein [Streptomyces clavuligerus]ANW17011.1 amidase [Streptomyces clavuligerus]AXU11544.1 amidase [Streptomyces clavuligerus]EDY51361.1 secreted amidase [Streptomyces clavuligerus]EFG10455.1 secreted amidase [Streptomyces clavuligerus]MBY6301364.1 amidase [Streptomyces clavuligerus]
MRPTIRTTHCALVAAAVIGLTAPLAAQAMTTTRAEPRPTTVREAHLERMTILDIQRAMDRERLTSEQLTDLYLKRIRALNPRLRAVVTVNPDAKGIARDSDRRRRTDGARGPLEGIPVLLKENMNTADRQPTTAGSAALLGARPNQDAEVVKRLRAAGAVILGKANMTEWANFRDPRAVAGWSAVGGLTRNPYVLDRSAGGSSSGSAAAAAANLATVTLGTDTGGSIVDPAGLTSTVGVRPTLGVASRTGIVPISSRHDTPGPVARNVTDAALTLAAIAGTDPADPDTAAAAGALPADIGEILDRGALRGKRIGVWRAGHIGVDRDVDRVFEATVRKLKALGATVVEGADVTEPKELLGHLLPALLSEFKHDINAYLAATPGSHPENLAGLIAYNEKYRGLERMDWFGQMYFTEAQKNGVDLKDPAYRAHRAAATDLARRSIDDVLKAEKLDAIVTPTGLPAPEVGHQAKEGDTNPFVSTTNSSVAAGYPQISVPAGYTAKGLPLGVTFLGTKASDARLLGYAYAFEQAAQVRKAPRHLPSVG